MEVTPLDASAMEDGIDVLCDAFADYPVMRFVIGADGHEYAGRLRSLITFFTVAPFLKNDLVLGAITSDGLLAAVANITRPGGRPPAPDLDRRRAALWQELGGAARQRYEALGEVWSTFSVDRPHYHLNMIGVRRSHHGRGAARLLLDALHAEACSAAEACGVSLTTEDPINVPLYQHFGYVLTGHARVAPGLATWGFFRPPQYAAPRT